MADVEWLRPQVSSPAPVGGDFLCNASGSALPDESLHRQGLQVDVDIHMPHLDPPLLGDSGSCHNVSAAVATSNQEASSSTPLLDLLDLEWPSPEPEAPVTKFLAGHPPAPVQGLPVVSAGLQPSDTMLAAMPVAPAAWPPVMLPVMGPSSKTDRPEPENVSFDFVSQMMTQAGSEQRQI